MGEGFYSGEAFKSSELDTWATPRDYFGLICKEFDFGLDAAALKSSTLVPDNWYGPDHDDPSRRDAFLRDWSRDCAKRDIFLNPPYGRTIGEWMAKADLESGGGKDCLPSTGKNGYGVVARFCNSPLC